MPELGHPKNLKKKMLKGKHRRRCRLKKRNQLSRKSRRKKLKKCWKRKNKKEDNFRCKFKEEKNKFSTNIRNVIQEQKLQKILHITSSSDKITNKPLKAKNLLQIDREQIENRRPMILIGKTTNIRPQQISGN